MKYPMEEDILLLSVQENLSHTYDLDERLSEGIAGIPCVAAYLPEERNAAGKEVAVNSKSMQRIGPDIQQKHRNRTGKWQKRQKGLT